MPSNPNSENNIKTLYISKSDKGYGLVLMNKTDYIDKMNSFLNNLTKFQNSATLGI